MEKDVFEGLNPGQHSGVETVDGPVIILAGAGAGKTTVLVRRAAYMINERVPSENILMLTFTNKAANEIRDRITEYVGEDGEHITAGTFHSFALRHIIKPYAARFDGIPQFGIETPRFVILDQTQSEKLLKAAVSELSDRQTEMCKHFGWNLRTFSSEMSVARAFGMTPEMYPAKGYKSKVQGSDEFTEVFREVWDAYTDMCRENNGIDFDDILVIADQILKDDPAFLLRLSERYRYIMIDEYQDTNKVQMSLMDQMADFNRNIAVVGDIKQSIYKFRGADISIIKNFTTRYQNAKLVELDVNYRSTADIINVANNVAHSMQNLITDTSMTPGSNVVSMSRKPEARMFAGDRDEAAWIASDIKERLDSGVSPEDIAILYRAKVLKQSLEPALLDAGIPYVIMGDMSFFDRKEVKDFMSGIRFAFNMEDTMAGMRLLDTVKIGVSEDAARNLMREHQVGLYQALKMVQEKGGKKGAKVEEFLDSVDMLGEVLEEGDATEVEYELRSFWQKNIKPRIEKDAETAGKSDGTAKIEAIIGNKTRNTIVLVDHIVKALRDGVAPEQMMEELMLLSNDVVAAHAAGEEEDLSGKIKLMTIHASKGLEFDTTYVSGMDQAISPGDCETADDLDEERRTFYVAMTRAKNNLLVTGANTRLIHGQVVDSGESIFVREAGDAFVKMDVKQELQNGHRRKVNESIGGLKF